MSQIKIIEPTNIFNKWNRIESLNDKTRIIASSQFFYPVDMAFYVNLIRKNCDELVATEIWPSSFCNHHCIFCSSDIFGQNNKYMLEINTLKKLILDLSSMGNKVVRFSGGGEPFLLNNLDSIIELITEKGMHSLFITNSSLLKATAINMLAKFSSVVRISFNGGTEEDYSVVYRMDHFQKVINNMQKLSSERIAENREDELLLGATFVVTPQNFKHISNATSIVKDCGFDFILIRGLNPIRSRFIGSDYDILRIQLQKSHEFKSGDFYVGGSITKLDGSRGKKKIYKNCHTCNFRSFINSDGNVYPCFSAIMHKQNFFGNIYKTPITKIWENLKHVELKNELNNGSIPEFCNKFCDHVEFNAFIDWVKTQLDENKQTKFRRIPRGWAEEFIDDKYKNSF
ncbi:MAG: radical SAM protein [Candidatus Falkowbacteria bacterium]